MKLILDKNVKIYDFMKWNNTLFIISSIIIIISVVVMIIYGWNWGIDFTGGIIIEITFEHIIDLEQLRNLLKCTSFKELLIQNINNNREIMIRIPVVENNLTQTISNKIIALINENINQHTIINRIEYIGPSMNNNLKQTSTAAVIYTFICILLYVSVRFEWRLALAAVLALLHDILITIGILSMFAIEIDVKIIAALISVISYSLNDSIVVFDRIRENFHNIICNNSYNIFNISLTQTLYRTLITSITTIIALFMMFIFGGKVLHGFAITLIIGVFIGTLSSIYVASALALKFGIKRKHLIRVVNEE